MADGVDAESQLDFENQIFVELLSEDGLIILARQVLLAAPRPSGSVLVRCMSNSFLSPPSLPLLSSLSVL